MNNNIWLHRISYHAEVAYPLLEKGYLSIGFSDFAPIPNFITASCTSGSGGQAFEDFFKRVWGSTPKTRWSLWRFIAEMEKGDWVVVPGSGTFSVFKIIEPMALSVSDIDDLEIKDWHGNAVFKEKSRLFYRKIRDKDVNIDLGFLRKVELIAKDISRAKYADAWLTARLKIRNTNANITDLRESVQLALDSFEQGKPLNIYSEIIEKTQKPVLEALRKILAPDKLESLVKWFFERIGASQVYIPPKNESGKEGDSDIVAIFEPIKTIIYTQVKFHGGETSSWAIDQINAYRNSKDALNEGYSKIGWVISSCDSFSSEAQKVAKESAVQLFNGLEFTTMLLDAGFTNLDKQSI